MAKYITAFFVFALLKLISAQTDNLILSEIMFYPSTSNSEFIELYNMSSSESIDLTNFKIEYQTSSADLIIEHEQGILLEPMSYAVIMEGDYDFLSGIYKEIIDERSLVVKINNNSFGSSGMANSSDRTIRLLDSLDNVIDSVVYSADNNEGFSDEKIVLGEENQTSNWANSYVFNGTPGFVNSVSPVDYDLGIEELMLSPENIFEGETLNISVRIKNFGVQPASNYSITIYNDLNQNATGEPEETIFSDDYFNLSPLDSILVTVLFENVSAGIVYIIAQLYFDDDQNEFNNLCFSNITVLPRLNNFNDLVINEIMYSPPSGQPEWIELFNNTEEAVNLKRWKFADKSSKPTITDEDVYIPSKGYIILADDTSLTDYYTIPSEIIEFNLPSLNNGGDNLYLFD